MKRIPSRTRSAGAFVHGPGEIMTQLIAMATALAVVAWRTDFMREQPNGWDALWALGAAITSIAIFYALLAIWDKRHPAGSDGV